MAASVWSRCTSTSPFCVSIVRSLADTMPPVTVGSAPRSSALPIATTGSPTRIASESPIVSGTRSVRVDAQHRQVGAWVGGDQLGRFRGAVVEGHGDLCGALDHVVVRDDVAVGRPHEARSRRLALDALTEQVGLGDGRVDRDDRRPHRDHEVVHARSLRHHGHGGGGLGRRLLGHRRHRRGRRRRSAVVAGTVDEHDAADGRGRDRHTGGDPGREPASRPPWRARVGAGAPTMSGSVGGRSGDSPVTGSACGAAEPGCGVIRSVMVGGPFGRDARSVRG